MKITEITIGDEQIWLVIEPLRFTGTEKVEANRFVCFFKLTKPNAFSYGQLLKKDDGRPMEFATNDKAVEFATAFLTKKIIFKHPLHYKKEELQKLLNIPLRIKYSQQNISNEVIGTIKDFSVAHNPPNLPFDLELETSDNRVMWINIFDIEHFRNL